MIGVWRLGTVAAAALAIALSVGPAAQAAASDQLSLAREVVEATGDAENVNQMVPIFLDEAKRTFTRTQPGLGKDLDDSIKALRPEFEKRRDTLLDTIAGIYASKFSAEELEAIKTFFTSPTGAKYSKSRPELLEAAYGEVNAFSRKMSQDIITRLREEMKKRGHDL